MAKKIKPETELPKLPRARPSDYTPELADLICARIIEGESLRSICKDDDMPSAVSVYAWLRKV